jgi:hypothetical protein
LLHDAAQPHLPAVNDRDHDVGALDAVEFVPDRSRAVSETGARLPPFKRFPEHVGLSLPRSERARELARAWLGREVERWITRREQGGEVAAAAL